MIFVASGYRTQFTVEGLAPSALYKFRLKTSHLSGEILHSQDISVSTARKYQLKEDTSSDLDSLKYTQDQWWSLHIWCLRWESKWGEGLSSMPPLAIWRPRWLPMLPTLYAIDSHCCTGQYSTVSPFFLRGTNKREEPAPGCPIEWWKWAD